MDEIRWSPGIGDPTVMGWVTVFAYFAAAWLCLRAFMVEKAGPPRPYRKAIGALWRVTRKHWPHPPGPARRAGLWLLLSLSMLGLGFNKQLDLQTLLTEIGRVMALQDGWYDDRRSIQVAVIGAICVLAIVVVLALAYFMRKHLADFRLPIVGMGLLVAFVVIRATSFHDMDAFIGDVEEDFRMNWVLELGGIGLVAWAAARRLRKAGAPVWRGWPPPSKKDDPGDSSTPSSGSVGRVVQLG